MQLQLNIEAGWPATSMKVAQKLADVFLARTVKVRQHVTSYAGPDGPVRQAVFVAEVHDTPFTNTHAVLEVAVALAKEYEQDCIAVMVDRVGYLAGPRADRWLPFNPAFFVEYRA